MKSKKKELGVDFIGGQGSLTAAEENALSDFFKQGKLTSHKPISGKKPGTKKRPKVTV